VADKRAGIVLEAKNATAPAFRQVKQEFNLLKAAGNQVNNVFTGIGQGIGQRFAGVAFNAISAVTDTFTQAIPKALAYARSIDEITDATGASAENASVLAGTLNILGIPTEGLATTFRTLSGEITTNEKKFAALGISVRDQNGQLLDTVTVLDNARSRFARMGDGAAKTAVAVDLFGRSALQLIDYLNLSDEAAASAAAELDKMGLILDANAIRAAEDADRSFNLLGMTLKGLQVELANQLLPAIINIVNAVRNWVMENREGLLRVLSQVTAAIAGFISGVLGANNAVSGFINSLRQSGNAIDTTRAGIAAQIQALRQQRAAFMQSGSSAGGAASSTQKLTAQINSQIAKLKEQRNALREVISEQARQAEQQFSALLAGMSAAEQAYQTDQRRAELNDRIAQAEKEAADSRVEAQREITQLRSERDLAIAAESDLDRQFRIAVDYAGREQELVQRYADEATRLEKAVADARADIVKFELEVKRQAALDEQRAKIEAAQTTAQEIGRIAQETNDHDKALASLRLKETALEGQLRIAQERNDALAIQTIETNLSLVRAAILNQEEQKRIAAHQAELQRQSDRAAKTKSSSNAVIAAIDAEIFQLENQLKTYKDVTDNGLNPLVNLQERLAQQKDTTASVFESFKTGFADAAKAGQDFAAAIRAIASALKVLLSIGGGVANILGFLFRPFAMAFQNLAGIAQTISGKAAGGPVTGGTPYIVGERGPELFVPQQSGSIVPNNAMGGVNITIQAGALMGNQNEARQFARSIYDALADENARRGGLAFAGGR
jgi:hypothetical protein